MAGNTIITSNIKHKYTMEITEEQRVYLENLYTEKVEKLKVLTDEYETIRESGGEPSLLQKSRVTAISCELGFIHCEFLKK